MKEVLSGIVIGVLVFFGLLFTFAGATGTIELFLWLAIGVLSGVLVTKLLQFGRAES